MKRILSVILSSLLIVSCLCITVSAEETLATIKSTDTNPYFAYNEASNLISRQLDTRKFMFVQERKLADNKIVYVTTVTGKEELHNTLDEVKSYFDGDMIEASATGDEIEPLPSGVSILMTGTSSADAKAVTKVLNVKPYVE